MLENGKRTLPKPPSFVYNGAIIESKESRGSTNNVRPLPVWQW